MTHDGNDDGDNDDDDAFQIEFEGFVQSCLPPARRRWRVSGLLSTHCRRDRRHDRRGIMVEVKGTLAADGSVMASSTRSRTTGTPTTDVLTTGTAILSNAHHRALGGSASSTFVAA
jgi:hypothetical protein